MSFPVAGYSSNGTNLLAVTPSWLDPENQECCWSLNRSTKNQRHNEFMRVFCGLNPSLASSLICLRHHWPTFMSLLCRLSPPPLCLSNKTLTPSGFQRHLRGNSLQCVDASLSCWFPLCAQSCRKGKPEKAHLTGRWVKIYLISLCAILRVRPPPPALLKQHLIPLVPTRRAKLSVFALDQRRSNVMSVSGVSDVLDVH